jgi:peptidoglycan/LPS O-acetylase OafA/YrhL
LENDKQRLVFLDNIKVFLTILLIVHHVGQAYGPTGGFWEYKSSLGENIPLLGRFFAVNASFFMGFFFFISGYFMVMSHDKNNGRGFIKKRFIKLGIPLLFIFFIMKPLQMYFHYTKYSVNVPLSFFQYYINIWFGINGMPEGFIVTDSFPEMSFGHAWYIEHLLVYAFLYWILRIIAKRKTIKQQDNLLSIWKILIIASIMSAVTTIVMHWYPYDKWIGFLGFFQVEVAHWPQYLVLFIAGCIAYRKNWIFTLKTKTGYILFLVSLFMIIIVCIGLFRPLLLNIWGIYSSFLAAFIIFGMITFYRERYKIASPFMSVIARVSYAAYLIHFPIVLIIQYALDKVSIGGSWGKFIFVSFLSVVVTYSISYLLIRIKYLNTIL